VTYYVPGTEETDLKKIIMSLQQAHSIAAALANNQFGRVELITTAQTGLSDSTYTKINFNNVSFDTSSIWDASNKQFKPTIAGYYRCSWSASLIVSAGNVTGIASLHKGARCTRPGYSPAPFPALS
jgi:hypothetical protein